MFLGHRSILKDAGRLFPRLLALMLLAAPAWGAYVPFRVASQIGGTCNAVAVSGTTAFIGEGPCLAILNVNNPAAPSLMGRVLFNNLVLDVLPAGSRTYVAVQGGQVAVVDTTNLGRPTVLGRYTAPGDPRRLGLSGSYLYVAYNNLSGINSSGLLILNIANPAAPALVKNLNTYMVTDVALYGSQAYCVGDTKLRVFNVAAPASASLVKTVDLPNYGNGRALQIVNKKIYVCVDNASPAVGLQVYDISANALNPAALGHCAEVDQPYDVAVVGDKAYVATLNTGLKAVNLTNLNNPTLAGGLALSGQGRAVAAAGARAYMASQHGGFHIVNVSNLSTFVREGGRAIATYPNGSRVIGSVAYVADGSQGLQFFDVSQPSRPVYLGRQAIDDGGEPEDVEISSGKAYVGGSYGLFKIISVANLAHPAVLGSFSTPSWVSQVRMAGNFAMLACQSAGTVAVNVSNPALPTQAAILGAPRPTGTTYSSAYSVAVSGSTVYVGYNASGTPGAQGLQIMNFVQSPPKLSQTRDYADADGTVYDVKISNNRAYLACYNRGLEILDLSTPGTPGYLGSYATPGWAFQTALLGGLAIVADAETIEILDVNKPAGIVHRQTLDLPGALHHVTAFGARTCLVSSREGGLYVLEQPVNAISGWSEFE